MRARRRLTLAAGLAAASVGLLFAVRPGLAAGIDVGSVAVLAVGYVAFVFAANALLARYRGALVAAQGVDPGATPVPPTPGEDLDDRFARAGGEGLAAAQTRKQLRDQLEELAIEALVRRRNHARSAARERVDEGRWTDDPVAASYLAGVEVALPGDLPPVERARLYLSTERRQAFAARRTAREIAALVEGDRRNGATAGAPRGSEPERAHDAAPGRRPGTRSRDGADRSRDGASRARDDAGRSRGTESRSESATGDERAATMGSDREPTTGGDREGTTGTDQGARTTGTDQGARTTGTDQDARTTGTDREATTSTVAPAERLRESDRRLRRPDRDAAGGDDADGRGA